MSSRQYIASELFERVSTTWDAARMVLAMGGNIGGTISLLPKCAGNDPLKRNSQHWEWRECQSCLRYWTAIWGTSRIWRSGANVAYQDGGSAVEDEEKQLGLAALELIIAVIKLAYQLILATKQWLSQTCPAIIASSFVPKPIDGTIIGQTLDIPEWKDLFGTLRWIRYHWQPNDLLCCAGYLGGEEKNSLASLFYLNAKDGVAVAMKYRFGQYPW